MTAPNSTNRHGLADVPEAVPEGTLEGVLEDVASAVEQTLHDQPARLDIEEVGTVLRVGRGVADADGLPHVGSQELLRFEGGFRGMALTLKPNRVGIALLDAWDEIGSRSIVRRTGRVVDVPVGDKLLGRVIDPTGRPLDRQGPVETEERRPIERSAPEILDRAPVSVPLQTGLRVVDALIPVGRGQRELILGDRRTGKTAIAVDAILNQRDTQVRCIYCAIGLRGTAVARVVDDLRSHGAFDTCTVVFAGGDEPPGLKYVAPYAAMSMAEYYMDQGQDALVVFDDLTRHARAYRELSLLLRRPPAREAYPGDIFYVHARLLERATHLRDREGGGSVTALPIIETQAQNISAYIPTNLISITDGQIYLSPTLQQRGVLPAVDVGKSVSRVGGKAQLDAYRAVAGDLRLAYSQFEELESFARFGTRLDEETKATLARGRRVREVLKQPQYHPRTVPEQIAVLLSLNEGLFDSVPTEQVGEVLGEIQDTVPGKLADQSQRIRDGEKLLDEDRQAFLDAARSILKKRG